MYEQIQPVSDDVFFIGAEYEQIFDQFESVIGLKMCQKHMTKQYDYPWGLTGRFAWKHKNHKSPLNELKNQIEGKKSGWLPLKQGLFEGVPSEVTKDLNVFIEFINSLNWM